MENIRRFEGLWEKCTSSAVGINACDQFDHFIIGTLTYIIYRLYRLYSDYKYSQ